MLSLLLFVISTPIKAQPGPCITIKQAQIELKAEEKKEKKEVKREERLQKKAQKRDERMTRRAKYKGLFKRKKTTEETKIPKN